MNYTKSFQEAAEIAINAGTDMDLNQGKNVLDVYTVQNVEEGKVKEQTVREAVRRGYVIFIVIIDTLSLLLLLHSYSSLFSF